MINRNFYIVLFAVAPLCSYFVGRLNRYAGVFTAAGLLLFSGYQLLVAGSGPALILVLYAVAALVHSFYLNTLALAPAENQQKLNETKARLGTVEKTLKAVKQEFAAFSLVEKKAATLYSVVKLLAEAVDIESAGKQLGHHVKDYFGTGDFALYINDLNTGQPVLFACGEQSDLGIWTTIQKLAEPRGLELTAPVELAGGRLVFAPVLHSGASTGLFVLRSASDSKPGGLGLAAKKFTEEISFAVKRMQLFRQVEWLSQVDGLTGVHRRNALDEKISEEIKRAGAFKTTLGFMIVDIDHFKKVNDAHGHQFGDFVLKRVGELLRSSVYETDFVGRYGGEEFGIVLPRADFAGVIRKAEAIRTKIEAEPFSQGFGPVKVTVSIGIAHFPRDGADGAAIIARADEALYRAKETGRNKVVDISSI